MTGTTARLSRAGAWAGVLAFLALLAAGAAGAAEAPTNRTILEHFNIIAFGNEYTGRRYAHVRKWRAPIRVGIEGTYPPYFEVYVLQMIRELRGLTGHPMRLYYSPKMHKEGRLAPDFDRKEINLILYYMPAAKMPKRLARYFDNDPARVQKMIEVSTCFAKFGTRKNEIRWAIVAFPDHHTQEHMRACVVEELTQVLGLPNDSNAVNPSIFNDQSHYFELTEHDKLMLRMLYDKRITVGMPRQDALMIGRRILDEIHPQ